MHLRQTAKYILLVSLICSFAVGYAYAQLNDSSEIIQTTEDINIQDDTPKQKTAPRNDEEFQREKITDEEKIEQEMDQSKDAIQKAQDDLPFNNRGEIIIEDEITERKEIPLKEKSSQNLQKTLQENADKQNLEAQPNPENIDGFAVDPSEEPNTVTEKPEDISPIEEEAKAVEEKVAKPIAPQEIESVEATVDEPMEEKPEYDRPEHEEYVTMPSHFIPLTEAEIQRLEKRTKVEIEREPYIETTKAVESYLKSFVDRRPKWTNQFSLEYTTYEPSFYVSDLNGTTAFEFTDYFVASDVPLVQLSMDFKRNFGAAAISLGVSGGYYTTSNNESDLTLIFLSLRSNLYLDTLFKEPYVVPYATLGWSYVDYAETYDDGVINDEISGGTDNFYVGAGLMFQLDWIDRDSDISSFEMGLENSFIFIEGRMYLDSGILRSANDPDLSSDLFIATGLKLEF